MAHSEHEQTVKQGREAVAARRARGTLPVTLAPLLLTAVALLASAGHAEEPDSPAEASRMVIEACRSGDSARVRSLASLDRPDPWMVVDCLLRAGESEAAAAFAAAAPREAVAGLPAYVEAQKAREPDLGMRESLTKLNGALADLRWRDALEATGPPDPPVDSIPGVRLWLGRGIAHRESGEFRESAEAFARAGRGAADLGWLTRAATCWFDSGWSSLKARRLDDTCAAWNHYLELARRLDHPSSQATAHAQLGMAFDRRGLLREALSHYRRSIEIRRAIGAVWGEAGTLNNMARLEMLLGRHDEARLRYEESLALAREREEQVVVALALNGLGNLKQSTGDYGHALTCYQGALEISDGRKDPEGQAMAHTNLGNLCEILGDFAGSLRHHRRALALEEGRRDRPRIAGGLVNLGNVQGRIGRVAEARRCYERALTLLDETDDPSVRARVLNNLGNLLQQPGSYETALAKHLGALEIGEELGDLPFVARVLNNIANDHLGLGDHESTVGALERALRLLELCPEAETKVGILYSLARLKLFGLRLSACVDLLKEAVREVARLSGGLADQESLAAREVHRELFGLGAAVAQMTGKPDVMAWFLEHGRAEGLREGIGSRAALQEAVIPPRLLEQHRVARVEERRAHLAFREAFARGRRAEMRAARKDLLARQARRDEVVSRIQREARQGAALVFPEPDDLATLSGHLREEEAFVLYGEVEPWATALVIRPGSARVVQLGLLAHVRTAVEGLYSGGPRVLAPEGIKPLAKLVVEPLRLGPEVRRVLVSPVGRLGYVPFGLLFPGREVCHIPSGTTYGALLAEEGRRGQGVLAVADPAYPPLVEERTARLQRGAARVALPRLPGTRGEAKAVGTDLLLGEQATESGLRLALPRRSRWRAVHFACHGLLDPERPQRSSLAITPDAADDGFLTCLEILGLTVPADLVVLSACETGKGRIYRTEGIVGLTRAFMYAGAPRVICSLWKVDDEATRVLMVEFYRLWNPADGEGLSAAAALRGAQDHVRSRERWKHPYFWAPWSLWGLPR